MFVVKKRGKEQQDDGIYMRKLPEQSQMRSEGVRACCNIRPVWTKDPNWEISFTCF